MVRQREIPAHFFWRTGATRALLVLSFVLGMTRGARSATESPSAAQQTAESPPQLGSITPYLGLPVDQLELPGVPPEESTSLLQGIPLKVGEALTRDKLHDTIQALFATGRFADIQAEADRTDTAGVRLRFRTTANF